MIVNCIYMYINKTNGKRYIGQTTDFNRRHKEHLQVSFNSNRKEYNTPIHRAIRKYGADNFEIVILEQNIATQEEMNELERFYIKKYNTLTKEYGYNISDGGSYGNPLKGKTEEEVKKIRDKCSKSMEGKMVGEKNPMYGKKWDEKRKAEMSLKNSGENNPFYGQHHSDETKVKISKYRKGQSSPKKGKHLTEETKQKLREQNMGENNPRAKKIGQYSKEGVLIKVYGAISLVEKDGFNSSSVARCCKGKLKTSGGFIWKYLN